MLQTTVPPGREITLQWELCKYTQSSFMLHLKNEYIKGTNRTPYNIPTRSI